MNTAIFTEDFKTDPWCLTAYTRWTDFNDRRGSRGHIVCSG